MDTTQVKSGGLISVQAKAQSQALTVASQRAPTLMEVEGNAGDVRVWAPDARTLRREVAAAITIQATMVTTFLGALLYYCLSSTPSFVAVLLVQCANIFLLFVVGAFIPVHSKLEARRRPCF